MRCVFIYRYNDWKQLLHMAVEHGSSKLVTLILEKGPIDVHSPVRQSRVIQKNNRNLHWEVTSLSQPKDLVSHPIHIYYICYSIGDHLLCTPKVQGTVLEKKIRINLLRFPVD